MGGEREEQALINVGIDAGGTLIKVAYREDEQLQFCKLPSDRLEEAAGWIQQQFPNANYCLTGGKASKLQTYLTTKADTIIEFDASCVGVNYLMERQGIDIPAFVLTNIGTGTSIHFVEKGTHRRISGTGIGGGTLMGLTALTTSMADYPTIIQLSQQGERHQLDLKVSDIYEGSHTPILGDLTASNFAKVNPGFVYQPADILASIIGLIAETVATMGVMAAHQHQVNEVVYIGSSFLQNRLLIEWIDKYTTYRGAKALFPDHGEYSGAIGALLVLEQK